VQRNGPPAATQRSSALLSAVAFLPLDPCIVRWPPSRAPFSLRRVRSDSTFSEGAPGVIRWRQPSSPDGSGEHGLERQERVARFASITLAISGVMLLVSFTFHVIAGRFLLRMAMRQLEHITAVALALAVARAREIPAAEVGPQRREHGRRAGRHADLARAGGHHCTRADRRAPEGARSLGVVARRVTAAHSAVRSERSHDRRRPQGLRSSGRPGVRPLVGRLARGWWCSTVRPACSRSRPLETTAPGAQCQ